MPKEFIDIERNNRIKVTIDAKEIIHGNKSNDGRYFTKDEYEPYPNCLTQIS